MPLNVLIVEDEPAIQELIAVNLEAAGHHTLRATDAEQALTILRETLPDLVLLDWMLPGQSGLSIARHMRSAERTRAIGDAPNGILRLRIESASFDAVMTLLARLDEREALRPSGVAITAGSESGRVDATLDFAGVTR